MSEQPNWIIRPAVPGDAQALYDLVMALATFEKLQETVIATPQDFSTFGFGKNPLFHSLLAESPDGQKLGFALFFFKFSTFVGRPTLHLEDLFVLEEHRGKGIGKALLLELVSRAYREGCGRMEWDVLNWNTPAIDFYESLGAERMTDWSTYRFSRETMAKLSTSGREG